MTGVRMETRAGQKVNSQKPLVHVLCTDISRLVTVRLSAEIEISWE